MFTRSTVACVVTSFVLVLLIALMLIDSYHNVQEFLNNVQP